MVNGSTYKQNCGSLSSRPQKLRPLMGVPEHRSASGMGSRVTRSPASALPSDQALYSQSHRSPSCYSVPSGRPSCQPAPGHLLVGDTAFSPGALNTCSQSSRHENARSLHPQGTCPLCPTQQTPHLLISTNPTPHSTNLPTAPLFLLPNRHHYQRLCVPIT